MFSKKILKNTMMLYFRQILLLFVSLYTVRVVLDTLGVEDYGVYSVIAGIVTLCTFLNTGMASATQRFFAFALGKHDFERLKTVFCVNVFIYCLVAIVTIALLESLGMWFINHHLNIPRERVDSAIMLFHCSVITFVFTVFTAPLIAVITAHEDMHYFAFISIIEGLLRLFAVILLTYLPGDKLVVYGILLLIVTIIIFIVYGAVCFQKYPECQLKKIYWDKALLKEIFSFTGWSLYGQLTTVFRFQAVTILINQFFNPSVAAARAIALTISSKVNIFSSNFNTSLYPPIVKNYASGNQKELDSLIFNGSKITFFLMWIFVLPLIIEMEYILNLWLTTMPEQAVVFTQLALVESLIFSISLPISSAARAYGKMKKYELTLGFMQISIFFIAYLILDLGYPAYSVFIVAILVNIAMFVARLFIVSKQIGLSKLAFLKNTFNPMILLVIVSATPSWFISSQTPNGFLFTTINVAICMILSTVAMYFIGLDATWRHKIRQFLGDKFFVRK
ncbi:lipopolysaccharide biosynthesis protein [Gayadomonas joobiniege]|uniref:lipopolysaccharide biosynthesis protein n=1 Tax=Gayadomonas joobiniege TaxID=1234606 RepID=UPI00192B03B9|nr:polysaccharide biosynthesis protein [Gayadomonas joobiniege]